MAPISGKLVLDSCANLGEKVDIQPEDFRAELPAEEFREYREAVRALVPLVQSWIISAAQNRGTFFPSDEKRYEGHDDR